MAEEISQGERNENVIRPDFLLHLCVVVGKGLGKRQYS